MLSTGGARNGAGRSVDATRPCGPSGCSTASASTCPSTCRSGSAGRSTGPSSRSSERSTRSPRTGCWSSTNRPRLCPPTRSGSCSTSSATSGPGVSTIYVSHRLDEVFAIVDRVSVLRDGVMQGTRRVVELDQRELVRMIVGGRRRAAPPATVAGPGPRPVPPRGAAAGGARPELEHDPRPSLAIHPGEIVGVAGLTGSGREEFASALIGAMPSTVDQLLIGGDRSAGDDAAPVARPGVALVPGNRGKGSAMRQFDLRENVTLPSLDSIASRGRIVRGRELAVAQRWIHQLDIRRPIRCGFPSAERRKPAEGDPGQVVQPGPESWCSTTRPRAWTSAPGKRSTSSSANGPVRHELPRRFVGSRGPPVDLLSRAGVPKRSHRHRTARVSSSCPLLLAQSEPQTEESEP